MCYSSYIEPLFNTIHIKQLSTRTIAIIALVAVAILAIGVFAVQKNKEVPLPMPIPENPENQGENGEDMTEAIDTSDWQTYRNEEYGFSFEYPSEWVLEEYYEEEGDSETKIEGFRYILLKTNDEKFSISLGIKTSDQGEWYFTHPWYTGIPTGDFKKLNVERYEFGMIMKQALLYEGEDDETTQMIRYCAEFDDNSDRLDWCEDFSVGNSFLGRVEIYPNEEEIDSLIDSDWLDIQKDVDVILESLEYKDA